MRLLSFVSIIDCLIYVIRLYRTANVCVLLYKCVRVLSSCRASHLSRNACSLSQLVRAIVSEPGTQVLLSSSPILNDIYIAILLKLSHSQYTIRGYISFAIFRRNLHSRTWYFQILKRFLPFLE